MYLSLVSSIICKEYKILHLDLPAITFITHVFFTAWNLSWICRHMVEQTWYSMSG